MITKELIEARIQAHKEEIVLLTQEVERVKLELKYNKSKDNLGKIMVTTQRVLFNEGAIAALNDLLKEFS